ncbi:hypothetical protein [Heyndrickxia oleronia]|uniref:hypothetical protein n=1 Tax=Heyndrickxia oleronia TaxID=38875 RepID=UPI003752C2AC
MKTVQDAMFEELFESGEENSNELLELLQFVKNNGVPLTDDQVQAMFILNEFDLGDIGKYAFKVRPELTPTKKIFRFVDKITLADRIKGNAKLGNLLKANMANPSQQIPASELQPKAMRMSELR